MQIYILKKTYCRESFILTFFLTIFFCNYKLTKKFNKCMSNTKTEIKLHKFGCSQKL